MKCLYLTSIVWLSVTLSAIGQVRQLPYAELGVKGALQKHNGHQVTVIFNSGKELTGIVNVPKEHVPWDNVHLTKIQTMEFYDAVIPLNSIAGLIFSNQEKK